MVQRWASNSGLVVALVGVLVVLVLAVIVLPRIDRGSRIGLRRGRSSRVVTLFFGDRRVGGVLFLHLPSLLEGAEVPPLVGVRRELRDAAGAAAHHVGVRGTGV